jgi:hypothetical protein
MASRLKKNSSAFPLARRQQQIGQLQLSHAEAEEADPPVRATGDADPRPEHQARDQRLVAGDAEKELRIVRGPGISPVDPDRARGLRERRQDRRETGQGVHRGDVIVVLGHDEVRLVARQLAFAG